MFSVLENMAQCISQAFPEYCVGFGYQGVAAQRPVLVKSVFLLPVEIRAESVDFEIRVYCPVNLGGRECLDTACGICNALSEGGFDMKNAVVGSVKYDNALQGFEVKISGTAADDSIDVGSGEVSGTIRYVSGSGSISFNFTAKKRRINCSCKDYPIMVMCDSSPIDVIEGAKIYKIMLEGVPLSVAEVIFNWRDFELSFSGERVVYYHCRCEKYEITSNEFCTITLISGGLYE